MTLSFLCFVQSYARFPPIMQSEKQEFMTTFGEAIDPAQKLHYVNREVSNMLKKIILFMFALTQMIAANLAVSYKVSVGGSELPGTFSREDMRRCGIISCAAVEEIARGDSAPAEYRAVRQISFRGADGDRAALCDALITSAPGVARCCEIYVGDTDCGTVADPAEFQNKASPVFRGITYRPVYTYEGDGNDYAAVCSAVKEQIKLT